MADKSQKTEKPTPKRRREARERGQIPRSADLTTWGAMLAATILVQQMVERGARVFSDILADWPAVASEADPAVAMRFAGSAAFRAAVVAAPLLLGLAVVTIVLGLGQVGLSVSSKRLKPEFGRLNPLKGLKRLVAISAWWEVGKALVKTGILLVVAWPAVSSIAQLLTSGAGDSLDELAGATAATAIEVMRNVSAAGLVIAAADYAWQRRRVTKELSMTRQELQEELKQQEGHPQMRQAMRSRQAAISRNRMIRLVSTADVVTVNPTHYAVALRYRPERGAPEVVAKGAGVLAARIRSEAEKHGVPIVREPVLTRAVYKACELGALVPVELYEAVAHVLAFVFGLRARGRAHGEHELPQPALL